MIFVIDTVSEDHVIKLFIKNDQKVFIRKRIKAVFKQSELLLSSIEKIFIEFNRKNKRKIKLEDLTGIEVVNQGGSFTSLRIGVTVANAMAFYLNIPIKSNLDKKFLRKFKSLKAIYLSEPSVN